MESCESVRDRDAEIRKLLEEKRDARKQKLLARLGRNLVNPLSVSSLEAITGTLRSKKTPAKATVEIKPKLENVSVKEENSTLKEDHSVKKKAPLKKALSFKQTATSLKRTGMANGSSILKRSTSFKEIPPTFSKPTVPQTSKPVQGAKQKLTVPYSPSFSARTRQVVRPPPSVSKPKTAPTPSSTSKKIGNQQYTNKQQQSTASSFQPRADTTDSTKRKSTSWMIPLTPEKVASPSRNPAASAKTVSSPRTPNVKPFVRKSFSESKTLPNRSTTLARSASTVAMARPSSTLSRKSVAPSTFGNESRLSRSIWGVPKEPSEQEKIQQWLEKRGRSASSCRHLSCLGHQLKDFKVPEQKPVNSSARKSIRVFKPTHKDESQSTTTGGASPQLKRNSSILNTTFEKEDDIQEEEQESVTPPPPAFQLDAEEVIDAPITKANVAVEETPEGEADDRFHTPIEVNKPDSILDANDLREGRVGDLLETIAALLHVPNYPREKIDSWIAESEAKFPLVKTHAVYWDIRARLEEKRGNTMEALDIYSEALQNKAEPLDTMKQLFDNFLLRIGSNMPTGEGTPLLKSLGVETPMIRQSRRLTSARRPLLDTKQAFNSTTVKYELKLKQVLESAGPTTKENATTMRKSMRMTPLKFTAASNVVSVAGEGAYQLVATPVRRSMRPKLSRFESKLDETVAYVDDLEQLSPTTKAKAVLRKNTALTSD